MPSQIEIDIQANTSQARTAVAALGQDLQRLKFQMAAPGTAGSGLLTPLPAGLGGPAGPESLLDKATAAAKRNAAALVQVGDAGKKTAQDIGEMGESVKRSGINFEAMAERMAVRLVVFEAIRLAIKGVIDIFKEVTGMELARVHFENLSGGADKLIAVESSLKATTRETNIEFGKLSEAVLRMEDAGEGPLEAAAQVDLLAERAAATGIDIDTLSKALEKVKLNEATAQDMLTLAHAAGTAKDQLLDEVNAYQRLTQEFKESEQVNNTLIAKIEAVDRAWEKEGEAAERAADRAIAATERQIDASARAEEREKARLDREEEAHQRVSDRRLALAEKLATYNRERSMGGLTQEQALKMQIGRDPDLMNQYRRGIEQINREEGVNAEMLVRKKIIGINDVMAAGRVAAEEERRARDDQARADREADEDEKRALQEQARARKQALEDITGGFKQMDQATKDLFAGQKEQDALVLAQRKLKIEQDLIKAMGDQKNIQGELATAMGTSAEKFASIATSLKTMVDESPQFFEAMQKIADLATSITGAIKGIGIEGPSGPGHEPGFTIPDPMTFLGQISGVSGIQHALNDMWKNVFPQSVVEDNKKTAENTDKLVQIFSTQ